MQGLYLELLWLMHANESISEASKLRSKQPLIKRIYFYEKTVT